jgi:hypothetical protein
MMHLLFLCVVTLPLQASVPIEDVAFEPLRDHCQRLQKALEGLKAPLPAETVKALKAALENGAKDPEAAVEKVQTLLDAHCLVRVHINPESRVKAARGEAPAELRRDQETVVLVKVFNEAGVTHGLSVSGPQVRTAKQTDGRWLEVIVHTAAPLRKKLSGARVEYVVLRLTARETGKREATLTFDVGQGTQDLGFRAEVPILFNVRAK